MYTKLKQQFIKNPKSFYLFRGSPNDRIHSVPSHKFQINILDFVFEYGKAVALSISILVNEYEVTYPSQTVNACINRELNQIINEKGEAKEIFLFRVVRGYTTKDAIWSIHEKCNSVYVVLGCFCQNSYILGLLFFGQLYLCREDIQKISVLFSGH